MRDDDWWKLYRTFGGVVGAPIDDDIANQADIAMRDIRRRERMAAEKRTEDHERNRRT